MAEEDVEKNLPPSERKLQKAREDGSGLRAPDLMFVMSLVCVFGGLTLEKQALQEAWLTLLNIKGVWTPEGYHWEAWRAACFQLIGLCCGILIISALLTFMMGWLLNGWIWSAKAVTLDFTRLNPLSHLKEMFSGGGMRVWWPTVKGLGAMGLMILGVYGFVDQLQRGSHPLEASIRSAMPSCIALVGFAIADFLLQAWKRQKSLSMSLQEMKDEMKESEGDPMIKGKMRQIARQRARSRMMSAITQADVVVVNPHHYLVALKWDAKKAMAPVVVAHARDLLALNLKEKAQQEGVPVLESPAYARALWASTKMDQVIPLEFYESIAAILAWAFALKDGRSMPEPGVTIPESVYMKNKELIEGANDKGSA